MSIAEVINSIDREMFERVTRNDCNLVTCRYNQNNICQNEDKRTECVEVSRKVLCLNKERGLC